MNNKLFIGLLVLGSLVGGIIGAKYFAPSLGGSFAGGVTPNQLLQASVVNGGVTPVGSLSFGFGGTAPANQITEIYTAVATYPWTPSSTSAITIASSSFTAAQTSTQIAFNAPGFVVNDHCQVQYTGTTSTLYTTGIVTAVNGNAVTSTITFLNATGATVPMTVTSTVTGVTSTVKATCFATGV